MKRSLLFLAATTVSLFGFSGQAFAYFTDGSLIQVVYQTNGGFEVATDLGAFAPTAAYTGTTQTLGTTVTAGSGVFSTATWGDLRVAYFVKQTTGADAWTSGPSTGQTSGNRKWTGFQSATTSVMSKYAVVAGTSNQGTLAKSEMQSYYSKLNQGGLGIGGFAGFIPAANGETSLANIGTVGYVDSYLYYYNTPNSVTAGTQVAKLRTYADGHTEVVGASPVPIPAPIFLLGSGLMALVGIKRKQTK